MTNDLERKVADHYGASDLMARLLAALRAGGADPDHLTIKDLAPVDEFHVGGRAATEYAIAKMALTKDLHALDVGCGIGGTARYIASTFGCHVTGIDLTPDYIDAARDLTRRTGLSDRVDFEVASALAMPFPDATFDAGMTLHVAMNIKDRVGLYREIARVLKPGAPFCIYDVMRGETEGVIFPVPWAETPETSHLTSPGEMNSLLDAAGLSVEQIEDRSAFGITFFRERMSPSAGAPPAGLHLLMPNARAKFENMLANIEQGRVAPVIMIARRR